MTHTKTDRSLLNELERIEFLIIELERAYHNKNITDTNMQVAEYALRSYHNEEMDLVIVSRWRELRVIIGYIKKNVSYKHELITAWHAMPKGFTFISEIGRKLLEEYKQDDKKISESLRAFANHKTINGAIVSMGIYQIINNYMGKRLFDDAKSAAERSFSDIKIDDRMTLCIAKTDAVQSVTYLSLLMSGNSGSQYQEEFNHFFLQNRYQSFLKISGELEKGLAKYYLNGFLNVFR